MNILVSILVPIYNVENFIEKCSVSLFEQTYKNIEYVFVNDCSPDHSIEVLEKVAKNYPNRINSIKIIKGEVDPEVIYKDALALILTSKVEGFGLVLLEAISRNIPCLSFKTSYGPLNIIKN